MADKDIEEHFSADRFVNIVQAMSLDPDHINIDLWIAHLVECTRLFKSMGKSMAIAFQDITSKAETINHNKDFAEREFLKVDLTLQEFIKFETSLGAINFNGENNKKIMKQMKSEEIWQVAYISTTRTVLRNLWLVDFLWQFFALLNDQPELSLQKVSKQAYGFGLAPHHPWGIRQVAKLAFYSVPKREAFIHNIGLQEEHLKDLKESYANLKAPLWKLYQDLNLEQLP